MNILYIANLSKNKWAGPNISVLAQVKAQSSFDNVFLYNQNHLELDEWRALKYFHNLNDFPTQKLEDLPIPFCRPDLVVFEGMYQFGLNKCIRYIQKNKIPYIIIPRSELTKQAQKQKYLKKKVANLLYFNNFIKNALAIQYLTNSEYLDSGEKWNSNKIIIPNGINRKDVIKSHFNETCLKLVYVGRLDLYHKGLDIMIEAISKIKNELRDNSVTIHLYGPDRNCTVAKLLKNIKENGLNDIIFINESIFGVDKERVLLDADVFFMTSRFEGHPMGLLEALSYGLPCLVTMGTNMGKEIENADAGWVAETNAESVKLILLKLLKSKETLQKKSKNALKLSLEYDWDKLAEITHKIYEIQLKNK